MSDSPPDPFGFAPVPSASRRRDGWTAERQRAFIAALAQIGIVSAAAKAAGMSRKSAYGLLKRAGPESGFARAWTAAQAGGRNNVPGTAIERALHGVEQPYFYRGIQRGTRRVYNDRLLLGALRAAGRTGHAAAGEGLHSPQSAPHVAAPLLASAPTASASREENERAYWQNPPTFGGEEAEPPLPAAPLHP